MNRAHKARLERAGWRVGTASELLGLTDAGEALVEAKLKLGTVVRTLRQKRHLSQAALAKLIGSSQPRVAKLENSDPEVSLDLQMNRFSRFLPCLPAFLRPRDRPPCDFDGMLT